MTTNAPRRKPGATWKCPKCLKQVTVGKDRKEYGHAEWCNG